jgi:hypothetical protein
MEFWLGMDNHADNGNNVNGRALCSKPPDLTVFSSEAPMIRSNVMFPMWGIRYLCSEMQSGDRERDELRRGNPIFLSFPGA